MLLACYINWLATTFILVNCLSFIEGLYLFSSCIFDNFRAFSCILFILVHSRTFSCIFVHFRAFSCTIIHYRALSCNFVYGWWHVSGRVTIMISTNNHNYYNLTCCIIQYVRSLNCISIIFCRSFLYESCVSIKFISSSST